MFYNIKPKIFMLHFAGGNCYSYNFLKPFLKDFELIPIELPGRGLRTNEQLITDFNLAASDIFDQIAKNATPHPFLIFGHSLGAYLALKVTKLLEQVKKRPIAIVVTGNPGPGVDKTDDRHLLDRNDFIYELQQMGGMPNEIISNPEIFKYFEPVLRADFEIASQHGLETGTVVTVPIFAIMGGSEELVEAISNWSNFTSAKFEYEILPGDHFFIYKHPQKISNIFRSLFMEM